jgi:hypothetical protein
MANLDDEPTPNTHPYDIWEDYTSNDRQLELKIAERDKINQQMKLKNAGNFHQIFTHII